jgi:hypothetical protein
MSTEQRYPFSFLKKITKRHPVTQSVILQLLYNGYEVSHSQRLSNRVIHSSLFHTLPLLCSYIRSNINGVEAFFDGSVTLQGPNHTRAFGAIDDGHLNVYKNGVDTWR